MYRNWRCVAACSGAGEAAAAGGALDNALDVASSSMVKDEHLVVIGAAKAYAGRAVTTVNRLAHQIHGAIGFTDEHRSILWGDALISTLSKRK